MRKCFRLDYQCTKDHQLHLQSWLVSCNNEKGLWWRYCASRGKFVKNYIALASLLKKRADLKKIFISDE